MQQYSHPETSLECTNHYGEGQIRLWRNGRQAGRDDGTGRETEAQQAAQIRFDAREGSGIAHEIRGATQDGAGQASSEDGGEKSDVAHTPGYPAALIDCFFLTVLRRRAVRGFVGWWGRMERPSGALLEAGQVYRITLANP